MGEGLGSTHCAYGSNEVSSHLTGHLYTGIGQAADLCESSKPPNKGLDFAGVATSIGMTRVPRAALLQHPPFDFNSLSDPKNLGQERSYSHLAGYSVNDQSYLQRRNLNSLTNPTPSSSLVVPANSELDFHAQSSFSDGPYHSNPHLLLSSPESTGGSTSISGNTLSSPFAHATLPKPYISNASASEPFAGAPALLSSSWKDPTMTTLDHRRLSVYPPSLSPAQSFTAAPSMNGYYPRPNMDRHPPNIVMNTPGYISHHRTPPFPFTGVQYSPRPYSTETPYAAMSMPQHEPQRPEGPPFNETRVQHSLLTSGGVTIRPDIVANISKGFFQVDNKWTCYRRNYFTVFCSFTINKHHSDAPLYLIVGHDKKAEHVAQYAVSISAKTAAANNQESETRGLVQHTPKRNKESESVPSRHLVVPAPPQSIHHQNGTMSIGGAVYPGPPQHSPYQYGTYQDATHHSAPSSYTFERIQFQKATANNGKRRAQQQYFHVVVELYASVSRKHGDEWILIADKTSEAMVVRGRSPGHYKDNNRRDSQTSMDPDRGPGSDGSSNGHHYGSYNGGSMDWQGHGSHNSGNHGSRYSDVGYRHCMHPDISPPSASSSTTLTGSPNGLDFAMSDADTLKSSEMYSQDRSRVTTPRSEAGDDDFFRLAHAVSRKRPYEEDSGDEESSFACSQPFSDKNFSHAYDLPSMAPSKILCAS